MKHLEKFSIAMAEGGHKASYRKMIITRVLARYETSLHSHRSGTKRMYRTKGEREAHIRTVGKTSKDDWFKKGGFTNCLTIPTTPGGRLAALVRETLEKCPAPGSTRTRVVERGGRSIRSQLVRSNPFPRKTCGREKCPLTWQKRGCQDKCFREQVGYSGHCQTCRNSQLQQGVPLEKVEDRVYQGETSRSLFTRGNQHRDDYHSNFKHGRKAKSSWMWEHMKEHHGGRPGLDHREDFQFRLLGSFNDCLSRQTDEAVRLEMVEQYGKVLGDRGEGVGGSIVETLNGRGEFFQPKIVQHIFYQQ